MSSDQKQKLSPQEIKKELEKLDKLVKDAVSCQLGKKCKAKSKEKFDAIRAQCEKLKGKPKEEPKAEDHKHDEKKQS